ncbi:MAG: hypothetical protein JSU01_14980 [Bacteroidetes bacterium]|nr:hypothetical protein [Bacteroidota bacterium]
MKSFYLLILAIIGIALFGCKKNGNTPVYPLNIYGKWNMLKDSAWNGAALPPGSSVYNGQAGDYLEFSPAGKCYLKEGNSIDTSNFTITSDTTISMAAFLYNTVVFYPKPSNPYKYITLTGSTTDPGGRYFYRKVWLGR